MNTLAILAAIVWLCKTATLDNCRQEFAGLLVIPMVMGMVFDLIIVAMVIDAITLY